MCRAGRRSHRPDRTRTARNRCRRGSQAQLRSIAGVRFTHARKMTPRRWPSRTTVTLLRAEPRRSSSYSVLGSQLGVSRRCRRTTANGALGTPVSCSSRNTLHAPTRNAVNERRRNQEGKHGHQVWFVKDCCGVLASAAVRWAISTASWPSGSTSSANMLGRKPSSAVTLVLPRNVGCGRGTARTHCETACDETSRHDRYKRAPRSRARRESAQTA